MEEEEEEGARAGLGFGRGCLLVDEEEEEAEGGATTAASFLADLKKGWMAGGLGVEPEREDWLLIGLGRRGGGGEREARLEGGGGFGEIDRGRFDEEARAKGLGVSLEEEVVVAFERTAVGFFLGGAASSDGGEEGGRSPFDEGLDASFFATCCSLSFPFPFDDTPSRPASPSSSLLLRLTKIPSSAPSCISSPSSSHPCINTPPAASPSSAANLEIPYALELSMAL